VIGSHQNARRCAHLFETEPSSHQTLFHTQTS
jgi:hypothetical protein